MLDRRRGDHGDLIQRVRLHARVHELIREQRVAGLRELSLDLDRAGGGVHLVVDGKQAAPRQQGLLVAVIGEHRDGAARHRLTDLAEIVFGHRVHHGGRLQLRDDRDAGGAGGRHVVARIDEAQTHHAVHGRGDRAITHLYLQVLHIAGIGDDRALIFVDGRHLGIERLLGDRADLDQLTVALQVELRVGERGLVMR